MPRIRELLTTTAQTLLRGRGLRVGPLGERPLEPLVLFEFEACPFCRKVREAVTELDLTVLVQPCPKEGTRFRPRAIELAGQARFPFLIDPNSGFQDWGSDDLVEYLHTTWGQGAPAERPFNDELSIAASKLRRGHGMTARPSYAPEFPLELWGPEGDPETRLVRELLCELELPYLLRPAAAGSPSLAALREDEPEARLPRLVDRHEGVAVEGAEAIRGWLEATYAG